MADARILRPVESLDLFGGFQLADVAAENDDAGMARIQSRPNTRRGWLARNQRRSNSLTVSLTSTPPLRTSRVSASSTTSPKESRSVGGLPARVRRSTVRTRAASSRGEKGFVT